VIYEIRLRVEIGEEWSEWLDGLRVSHPGNGETLLSGPLPDQAALFGLLAKVRDLGLPLLSVTEMAAPRPPSARADRGREVGTTQ
jgi:hypothetical protein